MPIEPLISDAEAEAMFNVTGGKPYVYRGRYPLHIESIQGISAQYREQLGGFHSAVRLNNGQVWGIRPNARGLAPRLGDDWDNALYRSEHKSVFLYQSPKRRSAVREAAPIVTLDSTQLESQGLRTGPAVFTFDGGAARRLAAKGPPLAGSADSPFVPAFTDAEWSAIDCALCLYKASEMSRTALAPSRIERRDAQEQARVADRLMGIIGRRPRG